MVVAEFNSYSMFAIVLLQISSKLSLTKRYQLLIATM
jgi:hypothetical protein